MSNQKISREEVINKRLNEDKPEVHFQELKHVLKKNLFQELEISGGSHRREILYATNFLIERAEKELRFSIGEGVDYSQGTAYNLEDWLKLDPDRKLKILFQNGDEAIDIPFYTYLAEQGFAGQISCGRYDSTAEPWANNPFVVADDDKFLAMDANKTKPEGRAIINISAPSEGRALIDSFDKEMSKRLAPMQYARQILSTVKSVRSSSNIKLYPYY